MKLSDKHFLQTFAVFLFLSILSVFSSTSKAYDRDFLLFLPKSNLAKDTVKVKTNKIDTIKIDTVTKKGIKRHKSSNAIKSKVDYTAKDSIITDLDGKFLYLYKDAVVTYEGITLKADFMRINQNTMEVYAKGIKDSANLYTGRPFISGQGSDLIADSLAYNFKSKKAKVWSGVSKEGEGFIRGGQMKLNEKQEGFLKGGVYTTCNDPSHMHFGIQITKAKVMKNRVVTGPAYLFIEDIPTPLVLPFGFFPKTSKRANGLIFPSVGEDAQKGFFLRDIGYYLGLTDNMDMALKGSIFTNGSYDLGLSSRYLVRYKYTGNLNFTYSNQIFGEEGTAGYSNTKDFRILWSHSQSRQGTGSNFSASVNAGTTSFYQNTGSFVPLPNRFNNTIGSSIAYSKTWLGTPFNLTTSLTTSQELNSGSVYISLPNLNFSVARITPFDSKKRIGPQRWYHKLGLNYNLQFDNNLQTYDSLLFKSGIADQIKTRITHTSSLQTNFNVLKYINISPSIPYTENWYFKTITKTVDSVTNKPITTYNNGFKAAREYSFSVSASTTLYGIKQFKKGGVKAIRHTLRPSVGYSYRPDFSDPKYGYYKTYTDTAGNPVQYSVFETGGPGTGKSSALSFSLSNNIEMKVRSKKDTINGEKKISILNDLSFSSSYNFAAEHFRLAPINMSGFTNLFKTVNLNFSAVFNPYATDSLGRDIDRYSIANGGPLVRVTSASIGLSANFNSKSKNRPALTPQQRRDLYLIDPNPNEFIDFNIPWNLGVNYSLSYFNQGNTSSVSQIVNINGDFSLTQKWKINGMTGYDFTNKSLSQTSLGIVRDLHCWDLSIYWIPFGAYKSYNIDLRVRSSILQDLKLSKRRPYYYNDTY
ncbi:putative LPS assembly protein LptD [Solitalea lacus]|uniref:putative LPS assembly protein LptD n=1 Tax=Solitalea lacus TaxID=2911172 RepID=UPI001EDACD61|nr:putative LPS assembly protein LptD [Solitalea lacus]UKJ05970.1 LPS-assembly protein LptD [Solitalea lacus]